MHARSSVRLALTPVAIGSLLLTAGCQSLIRSVGLDSGAKPENHEEVRTLLSTGQYETALEAIGPEGEAAPTDIVLWLLYQGTVAHHAGRYAESAEALDLAHYVSEARYTRRIGTGLFSLVTNDRVLPYVPDRTERLLIHYYAALDYLMLEQPMEAAVEARRLSFMLERYAEEAPLRDHPDLVAHMRLVAGLVFRSAGETNDAGVAFRLAYAAMEGPDANGLPATLATADTGGADPSVAGTPPFTELDVLLPARTPGGELDMPPDSIGEVIVLLERGFIAPRVEEDLDMALWEHELAAVGAANVAQRASTAACLADFVLRNSDPLAMGGRVDVDDGQRERCIPVPEDWGGRQTTKQAEIPDIGEYHGPDTDIHDGRPLPSPEIKRPPKVTAERPLEKPKPKSVEDLVRGPAVSADDPEPFARVDTVPEKEFVKLAVPTYRRVADVPSAYATAFVGAGDMEPFQVALPVNLSACVTEEFAAEASFVLAKTIARSAVRYAVARGLETGAKEGGEVLGAVIGWLADSAGDAMERADTRSWQLLPASIGAVRLRLPVGDHPLVIRAAAGDDAPGCDLGTVRVEAGRTPILSCRVWH